MSEKKSSDDLAADVIKAEKALDDAKDKHLEAGVKLEEARTAFQDARGEEAQKSQVSEDKSKREEAPKAPAKAAAK